MVLSCQRYDEIASFVAKLLNELRINSIPIDPFEIASRLGLGLVSYSSLSPKIIEKTMMESEDGFSFQSDYGWIIFYNDRKQISRIRFTIAHEIGHILLNHSQESDLAESEANYFARYLLAPPVLVQLVAYLGPSLVSDIFLIGMEATINALRQASSRQQYRKLIYCDADQILLTLFKTEVKEEGQYGIRQKKPS